MAVLDYKSALDAQVWTLLEANTVFTDAVKPGNRLKATVDAQARARIQRAPNDYPQVRVELRGNARMGQKAPKTFGMNNTAATVATLGDPIVPATQEVGIIVVHDRTRLGDQTNIEAAIKAALYVKYPKLGLAWVSDFTISEPVRKDVNDDRTQGVLRTVLLMLVNVSMRLRLGQLVG